MLQQACDLPFFPSNLGLAFIFFLLKKLDKNHVFEKRLIARNALFAKIKQWPLKSQRGKYLRQITSSDTTCICHEIYIKLFLGIDIICLLHY